MHYTEAFFSHFRGKRLPEVSLVVGIIQVMEADKRIEYESVMFYVTLPSDSEIFNKEVT